MKSYVYSNHKFQILFSKEFLYDTCMKKFYLHEHRDDKALTC